MYDPSACWEFMLLETTTSISRGVVAVRDIGVDRIGQVRMEATCPLVAKASIQS